MTASTVPPRRSRTPRPDADDVALRGDAVRGVADDEDGADDPDGEEYSLVMPFVTVASNEAMSLLCLGVRIIIHRSLL